MNSKAEFNRCHIPRLVVEEEDESSKEARLLEEKEYKEEVSRLLENQDLSWEQRKTRLQELADKKRSRNCMDDEGSQLRNAENCSLSY